MFSRCAQLNECDHREDREIETNQDDNPVAHDHVSSLHSQLLCFGLETRFIQSKYNNLETVIIFQWPQLRLQT